MVNDFSGQIPALWNLDMIDNGETVTTYKPVKPLKKFQGTLTKRDINGLPAEEGKLFSDCFIINILPGT